jgi:hypothetical protein
MSMDLKLTFHYAAGISGDAFDGGFILDLGSILGISFGRNLQIKLNGVD